MKYDKQALTRTEQMIVHLLVENSILSSVRLKKLNSNYRIVGSGTLNKVVSSLCSKGYLIRLKKGTFLVSKDRIFNAFEVDEAVFGGYIGLSTAMFIYGYKQEYSDTYYSIISGHSKMERTINGIRFIGVPIGGLAFGYTMYNGHKVSSKSKTLFDALFTGLRYIGDLSQLFRMIKSMNDNDFSEFMGYADFVKQTSLYERAGYLFEAADANKVFVDKLYKRVQFPVITRLISSNNMANAAYDRKWHIYKNRVSIFIRR